MYEIHMDILLRTLKTGRLIIADCFLYSLFVTWVLLTWVNIVSCGLVVCIPAYACLWYAKVF